MARLTTVAVALALALGACGQQQPSTKLTALDAEQANASSSSNLALAGHVTDAADVFARDQKEALAARLAKFEADTKHHMVIVTVPSLGGEEIGRFTLRLANRWGIGRGGYNDGVVLLVAPSERRARIEVGRGLESILTNDLCARIMADKILPRFEAGDMVGGINAGTDALIGKLTSG